MNEEIKKDLQRALGVEDLARQLREERISINSQQPNVAKTTTAPPPKPKG